MNNNDMAPSGWIHTTIGNVYQVVGGGTPSTAREEYWKGNIPWITSADIEGVRDIRISRYITKQAIENSTTNRVPSKTLLVVTRVGLGKIAIAQSDICFSQDLQGLIAPPELILPEFGLHYLSFALQALKYEGRGTTISGITKKQLKDANFPLPPHNEQKRIVAKIEELFSELDKGIENLKTAREQLKVYRQAVLKHAFEGKLTANWREKNKDKLETADKLLKRIKQEREAIYQKQLKEWKAGVRRWEQNGQKGKKPAKPRINKPEEPISTHESKEICELPESWSWIRPENIASPTPYSIGIGPFGSNLKVQDYRDEGVPLIFVRNITRNDFSLNLKYIERQKAEELIAHTVEPLDIVITKMGDPPGDCQIYPGESRKAVLTADCLKFRIWSDFAERDFYKYCIWSNHVKKQLGLITKGVAQKKISVDRFKTIAIPLPSQEEQKQIVREIESKFSVIDQLEADIEINLIKTEAVRQSILKRAFSGRLVAQDPKDEPAAVLLKRIKAEKHESPKRKKKVA